MNEPISHGWKQLLPFSMEELPRRLERLAGLAGTATGVAVGRHWCPRAPHTRTLQCKKWLQRTETRPSWVKQLDRF